MPRYVYAWRVTTDTWLLRAVVGPVSDELAAQVDRVIPPAAVEATLAELEERCALPFCITGELEAADWPEAAHRVRAWHFT